MKLTVWTLENQHSQSIFSLTELKIKLILLPIQIHRRRKSFLTNSKKQTFLMSFKKETLMIKPTIKRGVPSILKI